jgi:hypothetical protein
MTQHEPFDQPEDVVVGSIRIETEQDNTDTVWIWIQDREGRSIEGGAFDYAEFETWVRAYYQMRA